MVEAENQPSLRYRVSTNNNNRLRTDSVAKFLDQLGARSRMWREKSPVVVLDRLQSHWAAGCPSNSFTHSAFVPFIDFSTQWASNSARLILYAALLHSSYVLLLARLVRESSQTATLATYRSVRLSYFSLVSSRIPLRVLSTNSTSNMFRSHRGHSHDCHHDLPHPLQVHGSRTKGNHHVFWMYMVIELLAMFLYSGIIPTANTSYPVSTHHIMS